METNKAIAYNEVIITDPKNPTDAASMRNALYNSGQYKEIDNSFVTNHLSASTNTGLATFSSHKRLSSANSIYFTSGPSGARALRIPANNYIRFRNISNTSLPSVVNRGGHTISFWWKRETGTTSQWRGADYFDLFELYDTGYGKLTFAKRSQYVDVKYYKSGTGGYAWRARQYNTHSDWMNKLFDGDWHHVLFTWDGRTDGNKKPGVIEL